MMGKDSLNSWYDRRMYLPEIQEFYDGSSFNNLGYWTENTATPKKASENLMEKLLGLIPDKSGTILDVACGKGATTQYLLNYYPPEAVTGVNISERQLESCRSLAPDCSFQLMNATDLELEDESVDTIICVEAACHFDTREDFFDEAVRVLRPGGWLVLSDLLMTARALRWARRIPPANFVHSIEEYGGILQRAGFRKIRIENTTQESLGSFMHYARNSIEKKISAGEMGWWRAKRMTRLMKIMAPMVSHYTYIVASAMKPSKVVS
jgi:cyclopropane fatty-acyl-phospholipid synthase-like methyltransferase